MKTNQTRLKTLLTVVIVIVIQINLSAQGFPSNVTTWSTPSGFHNTSETYHNTLDMNNDGLPDLVHTYNGGYFGTPGNYYWKVYLNTGSGFSSSATNWSTPDTFTNTSSTYHTTMDMNNDGLPDLVHAYSGGYFGTSGNYYWKVYLNTGSGFSSSATNWSTPDTFVNTSSTYHTTMDMNHDGLPDLVHTYDGGYFGTSGNYYWKVYLNTGSGFSSSATNWSTPDTFINAYGTYHSTIDMNNDGLPDLVHTYNGGYFGTSGNYYWKIYLNTGSGFSSAATNWSTPGTVGVFHNTSGTYHTTMDMNNDGLPDLVHSYYGDYFGTSGNYYWKVYFNTGSGFSDMVTNWSTPGTVGVFHNAYGTYHGTMDMNNDGFPDLIHAYYGDYFGAPNTYYWKVYLTSPFVGIEELRNDDLLYNVYPNPTNNSFHMDLSHAVLPSLTLYTISGRILHQETKIERDLFKFDLTAYPTGIYFIEVKSNENIKTLKIIKT